MFEDELRQIIAAIPDIRVIRVVSVEGIVHHSLHYDDTGIGPYSEEDRAGAITSAAQSLGERIRQVLHLGDTRFTVIAGQRDTYFMLPVGDGSAWVIALIVSGQPRIDAIIDYFKARDYLVHLLPLR